jgi:hypothetical protein
MRPATTNAKLTARITVLNEEMDEIHTANSLYWKQGNEHAKFARAKYQWRQDRLEKIREELVRLRGLPGLERLGTRQSVGHFLSDRGQAEAGVWAE